MLSRVLAGLLVVVVAEDVDARDLLALVCESRGAMVRSGASAVEGMRLVASERPDVVVSDLGPGDDSRSLLRALRALPKEKGGDLLVVSLTGVGRSVDREAGSVAGFDAHLVKPVGPPELVQVIASLVAARPADFLKS